MYALLAACALEGGGKGSAGGPLRCALLAPAAALCLQPLLAAAAFATGPVRGLDCGRQQQPRPAKPTPTSRAPELAWELPCRHALDGCSTASSARLP